MHQFIHIHEIHFGIHVLEITAHSMHEYILFVVVLHLSKVVNEIRSLLFQIIVFQ